MKKHLTLRNAGLAAALATVTATAWATSEALFTAPTQSTIVPIDQKVLNPPPPVPVAARDTLEENESIVTSNDTMPAQRIERPAPVAVERVEAEPPITIEHKRLTLDERIQAEVMDRLATAPHLSGKIGVETHDAVVTLTGLVTTTGQAHRAGREAGRVEGVRYVENRVRAKVGGST